jgi:hypothetical protein
MVLSFFFDIHQTVTVRTNTKKKKKTIKSIVHLICTPSKKEEVEEGEGEKKQKQESRQV